MRIPSFTADVAALTRVAIYSKNSPLTSNPMIVKQNAERGESLTAQATKTMTAGDNCLYLRKGCGTCRSDHNLPREAIEYLCLVCRSDGTCFWDRRGMICQYC